MKLSLSMQQQKGIRGLNPGKSEGACGDRHQTWVAESAPATTAASLSLTTVFQSEARLASMHFARCFSILSTFWMSPGSMCSLDFNNFLALSTRPNLQNRTPLGQQIWKTFRNILQPTIPKREITYFEDTQDAIVPYAQRHKPLLSSAIERIEF